jgi:hypothetical protein
LFNNKNFVKIFGWFFFVNENNDEKNVGIIMEFVNGNNLNSFLIKVYKKNKKK